MKTQLLPLTASLTFVIAVGCAKQNPKESENTSAIKNSHLDLDGYTPEQAVELVKDYASWHTLVDHPWAMSPQLAILCMVPGTVVMPNQKLPETVLEQGPNPHERFYAVVYLNQIGEKHLNDIRDLRFHSVESGERNSNEDILSRPLPEGSVIVEGKYTEEAIKDFYSRPISDPELLTVMVKREKGFNPDVGDWWFGTFDAKGKPTSGGKLEPCMSCHKTQKDNDYIFTGNNGENSMYESRWPEAN